VASTMTADRILGAVAGWTGANIGNHGARHLGGITDVIEQVCTGPAPLH
jgi:hypothetical protein